MTTHLDRLTSEFNDDPAHAWHVFGPALIAVVRAAQVTRDKYMHPIWGYSAKDPDSQEIADLTDVLTALDAAILKELGNEQSKGLGRSSPQETNVLCEQFRSLRRQ